MKYYIEYSNLKAGTYINERPSKKISGPVSFRYIEMEYNDKKITIEFFGDIHESVQGLCSIGNLTFNPNRLEGVQHMKLGEREYIDRYVENIKSSDNTIFIKDYLERKGDNTEILIEHNYPYNEYNEIFCNISGKSKGCKLIPETYRDYAILNLTSEYLLETNNFNTHFVDIRKNLLISIYLTAILENDTIDMLFDNESKILKTIKSLEKIGRDQNINKFTKDLSKNRDAMNIQAIKISQKIKTTDLFTKMNNFLKFNTLDDILYSINYFEGLSNFANKDFSDFIKLKFNEKTYPYDIIYNEYSSIFNKVQSDQELKTMDLDFDRYLSKDLLLSYRYRIFEYKVNLMDLLSILSILYAIETKPIKNNFVLYQGDAHIRNVYNLFEKIMSKESLPTSSMFRDLTFNTIEESIEYDSAYQQKRDIRDQETIPANRCIEIDLDLYNKLNPQLQTIVVESSSTQLQSATVAQSSSEK